MSGRREKKSKAEQFRDSCISLFENSFLDNYKNWHHLMTNVNGELSCLHKDIEEYEYDDFCIKAKDIINSTIKNGHWLEDIINKNKESKISSATIFDNKKYDRAFGKAELVMKEMEYEMLKVVFTNSILSKLSSEDMVEHRSFVMQEFDLIMK